MTKPKNPVDEIRVLSRISMELIKIDDRTSRLRILSFLLEREKLALEPVQTILPMGKQGGEYTVEVTN